MVSGQCFSITCTIPNCNYCLKSSTCLVCETGYNLNTQSGVCEPYATPSCSI